MHKRLLFIGFSVFFSTICLADPLWHCTANNSTGAVWNQYGQTREETVSTVQKECIPNNDHKICQIICFPPRIYWRCLSHDTVPKVKESKNTVPPKKGTWYWASFSKQVAINGARDACRHNSSFGGCYVDPNACASS
jgi:hypothetical protein